jgi:hypothetical protein
MTHLIPRVGHAGIARLGILVLSPLMALAVMVVLLGLLGIFVLWLSAVGVLMAAMVLSDATSRWARRFFEVPMPALSRRAVG